MGDDRRIAYLHDHLLAALSGRVAEGLDLRGDFIWSLLGNWEWAAGFLQRFGLVHVDFRSGTRTPEQSFNWMRAVLDARATTAH